MWGKGLSGEVEYTGNEGASRETTYHCCVMIIYRKEDELELRCQSNLHSAQESEVKIIL